MKSATFCLHEGTQLFVSICARGRKRGSGRGQIIGKGRNRNGYGQLLRRISRGLARPRKLLSASTSEMDIQPMRCATINDRVFGFCATAGLKRSAALRQHVGIAARFVFKHHLKTPLRENAWCYIHSHFNNYTTSDVVWSTVLWLACLSVCLSVCQTPISQQESCTIAKMSVRCALAFLTYLRF